MEKIEFKCSKLLKVSLVWVLGLLVLFRFGTTGFAETQTTYSFDEVEVIHAAEFTAYPNTGDTNAWSTELAGGVDKPVHVLYGMVVLKNDGVVDLQEEFIKVTGENGSERFLVNSVSTVYDDTTNQPLSITSLFWSGKKLDGSDVVKDYSQPLKTVTMHRNFDKDGRVNDISLSFGMSTKEDFSSNSFQRIYLADMSSFRYAGNPIPKKSFGMIASQGISELSDEDQSSPIDPMDWIEDEIKQALVDTANTFDVNGDGYLDLFDITGVMKQKQVDGHQVKSFYGFY